MEANNLLQQKINFFQKSADTREQISKSENDRLKLEIELNKLLNSDDSKSKLKAIKLKTYYTKLCDDETKSMKRNQQLLTDLQRVDTQFQQLEIKLDRLTNLKVFIFRKRKSMKILIFIKNRKNVKFIYVQLIPNGRMKTALLYHLHHHKQLKMMNECIH